MPLTLIMCVNVSVLHPPCSGGDADGRWEKNSGEAVVAVELREDVLLGGARTRLTCEK